MLQLWWSLSGYPLDLELTVPTVETYSWNIEDFDIRVDNWLPASVAVL